ncbi:unnamed protein product [marine sediment metagenome]|jgi:type IV secretory pathway VirB3-like protein|uniref:Type IV secretory pathway VirB3 family protein n=1 Tax=marine sediment metagenome TaxID=412755 RepID=X1M2F6_9ZZZZ|nr:VirB3 family type IV secretion system protein [Cupriavidus basilensis]MDF3883123.1 VirB3 family type IV secretion system protein [Cupriavidus basilensis]
MDKEELITYEKIALGMTKPVMKHGVPMAAAAIIIAISAELFILGFLFFGNPFFCTIGIPVYILCRQKARTEERFMDLLASNARTRWVNRAKRHWKAVTYSPLVHRKTRRRVE